MEAIKVFKQLSLTVIIKKENIIIKLVTLMEIRVIPAALKNQQ